MSQIRHITSLHSLNTQSLFIAFSLFFTQRNLDPTLSINRIGEGSTGQVFSRTMGTPEPRGKNLGIEGRRYNLDVMMLAVLHQRELCMIHAIKVKTLA